MNLLNNETRWVREALFEQATKSKYDVALRYCDKDDVDSYSYSQLISLGYSLATQIEIETIAWACYSAHARRLAFCHKLYRLYY